MDLTKLSLEQLGGLRFTCDCGETHAVTTSIIRMEEGCIETLGKVLADVTPSGKILLVTASDIYERCAAPVVEILEQAGYTVLTHVFEAHFKPGIKRCGELFSYPEDVRAAVAVGSGSVTDCVRYYASVADVPFVSVPTAPSMDGYFSSISPLYVNGIKESFEARPPLAVLADLNLLATAPRQMIAAGFGDIMAKHMALFDWYFAYAVNGEKFCNAVADMVRDAMARCMSAADSLVRGERAGLAMLTDALLRSSAAMQLLDSSRCASGGEHHTAHALEMMFVHEGRTPRLHGEWVFLATRKLIEVYRLFMDNRVRDLALPPDAGLRAERMRQYFGVDEAEALTKLARCGGAEQYELRMYRLEEYRDDLSAMAGELAGPIARANKVFKRIYEDLGYAVGRSVKPGEFKIAMALAPDIREKFTTLTMMRDIGLLDGYLK